MLMEDRITVLLNCGTFSSQNIGIYINVVRSFDISITITNNKVCRRVNFWKIICEFYMLDMKPNFVAIWLSLGFEKWFLLIGVCGVNIITESTFSPTRVVIFAFDCSMTVSIMRSSTSLLVYFSLILAAVNFSHYTLTLN